MWKKSKNLATTLFHIKNKVSSKNPDSISLTMTGELSDAFRNKREGVNYILDSASQAFKNELYSVLNIKSELISVDKAKANPIEVAGANWVATGWLISQKIKNCVIIDVGSTSTSIIPIINGKISNKGNTDFEKLMAGELVYTGLIRTNIAAIVKKIPIREGIITISSEYFSQSGDVHLILGNIDKQNYSADTPDNRGKNKIDAMERLAKVVCGDLEIIKKSEIHHIAKYIYSKQIKQISKGLEKVVSNLDVKNQREIPVVVTGIGRNVLAKKAAQGIGLRKIIDISEIIDKNSYQASPAVGVGIMEATKLAGRNVIW